LAAPVKPLPSSDAELLFTNDKEKLHNFNEFVKENCPMIHVAYENLGPHTYAERPEWAKEGTSRSVEVIKNEHFYYIGEVKKDDSNVITGAGKKYVIVKQMLYEGWFKNGELCEAGRMI
jgi:hypothetical protein